MEIYDYFLHAHFFQMFNDYYIFDTTNYYLAKITKGLFNCLTCFQQEKTVNADKFEKELKTLSILREKDIFIGKRTVILDNDEFDSCAILSIATVHECNFRCKYCFSKSGSTYDKEIKAFSPIMLRNILNKFFFDLFPNVEIYRIEFVSGGEPLINFGVIQETVFFCEYMINTYGKKIDVWISTNGSVYREDYFRFLDSHNIRIGISIDGDEIHHNANRVDINGNGTYDVVVANFNSIKNNSTLSNCFRNIWGLSVITKNNYNVLAILKHLKELGFQAVQMKLVWSGEDVTYLNELKKEFEKEALFLLDEFKLKRCDYLFMILNDNDFFGKIIRRIILGEKIVRRCHAGREKITVCPNGDVYPCGSFVGVESMYMGNIFSVHGLVDACFQNKRVDQRVKCRCCNIRYLCGGDCYYNSFLVNGNVDEPDPSFCNLAIWLIVEMMTENLEYYKKICKELQLINVFQKI